MKLTVGERTDEHPVASIPGSWRKGKNLVYGKAFGAISNDDGFDLEITTDFPIIGVIPIDTGKIIFSTNGANSEIGVERGNGYEKIVRDPLLGFRTDCPIEGVYKYNAFKELVAVWSDGVLPNSSAIKTLNLDRLPFTVDAVTKAITQPTKINLLKLFPNVKHPTITPVSVKSSGGSLASGGYYFLPAYEITEVDITNYLEPSNPIFVADFETSDYRGVEHMAHLPGAVCSKSINLTISNLDTSFEYLRLAVVKIIQGVETVEEVGRFKISGSTMTITYYGQKQGDLAQEEVLVPSLIFDKINSLTVLQHRLYGLNYTIKNTVNIQKYVNNVKVKWKAIDTPSDPSIFGDIHGDVTAATHRTWMPDEVYAMYLHVIFLDGEISRGFHIPGAALTPTDLSTSDPDGSTTQVDADAKRFHVFDTSSPTGDMGKWQNKDETYPNSDDFLVFDSTNTQIGDLRNLPVRHHKFPMSHNFGAGKELIGIELKDVYFPNDVLAKIQGFFVSYARRGEENTTIIARGQILDQRYWYEKPLRDADNADYGQCYRFYDSALLHTKPAIPAKYLKRTSSFAGGSQPTMQDIDFADVRKYIPADYSEDILSNNDREEHVRITDDTANSTPVNFNFTADTGDGDIVTLHAFNPTPYFPFYLQELVSTGHIIYTVAGQNVYNPVDVIFGGDTFYAPESFKTYHITSRPFTKSGNRVTVKIYVVQSDDPINNYISIENGDIYLDDTTLNSVELGVNGVIPLHPGDRIVVETTSASTSVFFAANTSDHILTNDDGVEFPIRAGFRIRREPNKELKVVVNGETVYSENGGTVTGNEAIFLSDIPFMEPQYRMYDRRNYNTYTPYNLRYRYKDVLKEWWGYKYEPIMYDKSYNALNNIKPLFPYNPLVREADTFPYTVIRSVVSSTEEQGFGWRRFLANDSHTFPRHKGIGIAIRTLDRAIVVQMEGTLFIDFVKDKLGIDISEIFVGTGEIFDRDPQEPVSTPEGYIGSRSKFAAIVCKLGYFCVDDIQGKMFLIKSGVKEISNKGKRNEFGVSLKINTLGFVDNPFLGEGYSAAYDEKYDRLIISKNSVDNPMTISFNAGLNNGEGGWICEHEYTAHGMFNNREGIFSVNNLPALGNGRIFKHNSSTRRARYYDNVTKRSWIDVPFTISQEETTSRVFYNSEWITAVFNIVNNVRLTEKTITHFMIYTEDQCSGEIPVVRITNLVKGNVRQVEGGWRYNDFRDVLIDRTQPFLDATKELIPNTTNTGIAFWKQNKFIGKFAIVRLIYDNAEQHDFHLYDIQEGQRLSQR